MMHGTMQIAYIHACMLSDDHIDFYVFSNHEICFFNESYTNGNNDPY